MVTVGLCGNCWPVWQLLACVATLGLYGNGRSVWPVWLAVSLCDTMSGGKIHVCVRNLTVMRLKESKLAAMRLVRSP